MATDGRKGMLPSHLCASVFICGSLLFALNSSVASADDAQRQEFVISYWAGPPAKFQTLERIQEIKDAGFTLAFPGTAVNDVANNRKFLDLCQQVGLKAMIQDGRMPRAIEGRA